MKDEQVSFCEHPVPTCGNKKTNRISWVIFPNNVYIYTLPLCFQDTEQDGWKEGRKDGTMEGRERGEERRKVGWIGGRTDGHCELCELSVFP